MEKYEIGRFTATSLNKNIYTFIVYNDETIKCLPLNIDYINRIFIKPRLEFCTNKKALITHSKHHIIQDLIGEYNFSDELFYYLKEHNIIKYSVDCAYLYNLIDKNGYDKNFKNGSSFKVKNNKIILTKQNSLKIK